MIINNNSIILLGPNKNYQESEELISQATKCSKSQYVDLQVAAYGNFKKFSTKGKVKDVNIFRLLNLLCVPTVKRASLNDPKHATEKIK